ncbi:hypothetical protein BDV93DRAFT_549310 [Ceratobasidium sp. AG-I]|nr:hypothetical protein BDV93DRAFT_549310 [Ceratobasidium sp. AG-I]
MFSPVSDLENEMEARRPTIPNRYTKLFSRLIQNTFRKKPEHTPDVSVGNPTPVSPEGRCTCAACARASPSPCTDSLQAPVRCTPNQLRRMILQNAIDGVENLLVVSAQLCQETTTNGRDFLLVKVVDNHDSSQPKSAILLGHTVAEGRLLGGLDHPQLFLKIYSDGSEQCGACGHYESLEATKFSPSANPFRLYELAALVEAVAATSVKHDQGYSRQFATSVWICLKEVRSDTRQPNQGKHVVSLSRSKRRASKILSRYDHEVLLFERELKRKERKARQSVNQEKRHEIQALNETVSLLRKQLQNLSPRDETKIL